MKNLLITGLPRCGKTTLIKKIVNSQLINIRCGGFITEEMREKGERIGFKIISLSDGEESFLAKKSFTSRYRLGSYGINLEHLESIGVASIQRALTSDATIVIDEIGKMELYSGKFKDILLQAMDSPQKVLATIMERKNEFADMIKERKDVRLIFLNRDNFHQVFNEVHTWLREEYYEGMDN